MKMVVKCKLCAAEVAEPSLSHVKKHMQDEMESLDKADPSEFFDIGFKAEWDG